MVEFNLLSDRRDLERLMTGFRKLGKLYATPAMQAVATDPFPATYSDRVRKLGIVNTKNKIITRVAGRLLDGPAALRTYLVRNVITEGFTVRRRDGQRRGAGGVRAQGGDRGVACVLLCRMGADGDPMAVTDTQRPRARRRRACASCDASIFPIVPSPTPTSRP